MGCEVDSIRGEQRVVMVFKREELLDDLRNLGYVEGHVMGGDSIAHQRHTLQDIVEDGNVERVTRVLESGVARCRELLFPFTKCEIRQGVVDNRYREVPVYGIVMTVPGDFSQTTLSYLERQIHEYLVCVAMADWCSIVYPNKAESWALKARSAEDAIRVCSAKRGRRLRIRLHPF